LKKPTAAFSASAWADMASAVEESSSEAEAFRWVT
jgi:hypothetical protein